nr:hypothetical protein [Tanacetum cinerariifolium]
SEDESNDEENQELRLCEEARIQEEEDADELYRDVNINQGRGLQVTQNVKDSHVTLTLVNPDGLQETSSVSSINIDFAYLIWEDFVYQVEHKSQKRSNEMNYPRFTKVIIDYFMTRKPSISR